MAVTIRFTPEVERRLEMEAAREGRDPAEYARVAASERRVSSVRSTGRSSNSTRPLFNNGTSAANSSDFERSLTR